MKWTWRAVTDTAKHEACLHAGDSQAGAVPAAAGRAREADA